MEKIAWTATIKDGKCDEYISRHDKIWQDMKDVLKEAGIVNYTIWLNGNTVFGYYECTKGIAYAQKVQSQSVVVQKWNEYMKDVMDLKMDKKTGAQPKMQCVFTFN